MEINDVIKRVNELAAKRKSGEPLTEAEEQEKKELYEIYLGFIRGQVKQHLENIELVDPEDMERRQQEIYEEKQAQLLREQANELDAIKVNTKPH